MLPRILLIAATLALASCGKGDAQQGGRGQRGPVQVGFVVVQPTSVPLQSSLGGRTVAFETSEVRPQVNGLIRSRNFAEGSYVRKGQPLYQIDPRLYQAAVNQAQANVASARASLDAAQVRAKRFGPCRGARLRPCDRSRDRVATTTSIRPRSAPKLFGPAAGG